MNRRIVHLRHEEVEAQLGELDITILARQGTAMGQMRFASLRAPCSSGIYFLEGDYRLPECVCDSLILTRIGYVAPADNNAYIQVRKPQQAFYLLMRLNHPPASETGVHPSAIIAADVFIPEDCLVGPYCIIETGVQIGHGCRLPLK